MVPVEGRAAQSEVGERLAGGDGHDDDGDEEETVQHAGDEVGELSIEV